MRRRLAAVVPCYNAGPRLRPVAEAVAGLLDHVVVVDDGSTDGCVDGLHDLPVQVVRLPVNRGKGHALLAGFRAARAIAEAGAVAVLDADGQHDPAELPGLYRAFLGESADLVIGQRVFQGPGVPWRSRFGNRVTARLMQGLLGLPLADTQCGYRILSARFTDAVLRDLQGGRYETETLMIVKALREGYRIAPAPVATRYEAGNPSSHFRRIHDSARVMRVVLRAALARNKAGKA